MTGFATRRIYTIAGAGDFSGNPRPGLIVQSDPFNEFDPSVTVCPLSSHMTGDGLYRIPILPDAENALMFESEIEVDKLQSVWLQRLGKPIGRASSDVMVAVDAALRRWLDI
ncbi:type II toxin-antitoxin system PemK/MazF family toxin [Sandarakinorhabdus sp. DWP1-3-1]|uniref:type II toxin-antitoxin system PemK/MazF family toxin n=1 Tax=Sandarakinorhabdus sp. DWP1-3-1 TaxID=2804627 RepID=UPI003CF711FC